MISMGLILGASRETFFGLSGFGDLVGTCMGKWSRNRNFGLAIAKENNPDQILNSQKTVVEGIGQPHVSSRKQELWALEMPILKEVHSVLYESKDPEQAILDLMKRDLKNESNKH